MSNLNYALAAIRINQTELVEVTLSIKNVSDNSYRVVDTKDFNCGKYHAVIFHLTNGGRNEIKGGGAKEILLNEAFLLDSKINKIRVFYWNDDIKGSLDQSVLDGCRKFASDGNNEEDRNGGSLGDFPVNKFIDHNKEPRQAGNGGVVGISG